MPLPILALMIVPALFIFNRLQPLSDWLFSSRWAWLLLASVSAVLLAGVSLGRTSTFTGMLLALCSVFQLALYRVTSEMFKKIQGRAPESAFGQFDYQRMASNAPDRGFSFAYTIAALVIPAACYALATK